MWGPGCEGDDFCAIRNGRWGVGEMGLYREWNFSQEPPGRPEPTALRRLGQETNLQHEETTYLEFREMGTTFFPFLSILALALITKHKSHDHHKQCFAIFSNTLCDVWLTPIPPENFLERGMKCYQFSISYHSWNGVQHTAELHIQTRNSLNWSQR